MVNEINSEDENIVDECVHNRLTKHYIRKMEKVNIFIGARLNHDDLIDPLLTLKEIS